MLKIDPHDMEKMARIKWGEKWREGIADSCHVVIETVWRWRKTGMPIKYKGYLE